MNDENKSIHEFDFSFICEYFSALERQGPGSPQVTVKALSFIEGLNDQSHIADLGCGSGGQTLVLAQHTAGSITAIDMFPEFIDLLNLNAKKHQLDDRVKGVVGSMDDLSFDEQSLDLIWSEGAIYNIGFEKGLKLWHKYLKPGGYIAVSEATWFTDERPAEIEEFWLREYPGIGTIASKVDQMQKAGYIPVATFILPEECWRENFYIPQVPIQESFLMKYPDNDNARELVQNMQHEAILYEKYSAYYGYVFFIGKKIS